MVAGRKFLGHSKQATSQSFFSKISLFSDFAVEDPNTDRWALEAILLEEGDILLVLISYLFSHLIIFFSILHPCTPHFVLTTNHAIFKGSHFYAITSMQSTFSGIIHCLMLENVVTNTSHPTLHVLLLRMVQFVYQEYVETDYDPKKGKFFFFFCSN